MIFLENWVPVLGIIIFISFITKFQILPEEKVLRTIFGDEYAQYKKRYGDGYEPVSVFLLSFA